MEKLAGYQLAQNYNDLLLVLANEEDEETINACLDTLEMLESSMEEKADNTCYVINRLNAKSEYLEQEIKRLQTWQKQIENNIAKTKERLDKWLRLANKNKLETKNFRLSYTKSQAVKVIDISKIPKEFINTKITETPNKMEIKKYIKNGGEIEGVEIEQRTNLKIR